LIGLAESIGDERRADAPTAWLCGALWRGRSRFFVGSGPAADRAERVAAFYRLLPDVDRYSIADYAPQAAWNATEHPGRVASAVIAVPGIRFRAEPGRPGEAQPEEHTIQLAPASGPGGVLARQRGGFWLAVAGFHEFEYDERRFPGPGTVLWAAFRGVRMHLQGSLQEALEHYGATRRDCVPLCMQYLEALPDARERYAAAERVMLDFIEPVLRSDLGIEKLIGRFLESVRQIESDTRGAAIPIGTRNNSGPYRLADYSRMMNEFEADTGFLSLVQLVVRRQNQERRNFLGW
jgi:hypothetical protein